MVRSVHAVSGWGRGGARLAQVLRPDAGEDLAGALPAFVDGRRPVTVRGAGESYGDAALPPDDGGCVLDMSGRDGVLSLDADAGVVVAQSGIPLRRLQAIVSGRGWTVPVLPGSGAVTLGGAVASDVHGKNEPGAGSFGTHVQWLTLHHPDGTGRRLAPDRDPDAFWATVGGMGLTGVIDAVALRLAPISTRTMTHSRLRAGTLEQSLSLMHGLAERQRQEDRLHVMAWLDGASTGAAGRSVIDLSEPAEPTGRRPARPRPRGRRPGQRPGSLPGSGVIGRPTIRAAGTLHWRLTMTGRAREVDLEQVLWPLEQAGWWPAAFGRQGLVQYQLLLPDQAVDELANVLWLLHRQHVPPALAVLKRFTHASPAPLGFGAPGWSLAMDFPRRWPHLEPALRTVDELVVQHGGRVYLTKDSRLPAGVLEAMYPRLAQWRSVRDRLDPTGRMTSSLGVRLGLVPST